MQRPSGAILAGVVGAVYGLVYVVHRRQLAVPIVAHGIYDSIGFLTLYLGVQSTAAAPARRADPAPILQASLVWEASGDFTTGARPAPRSARILPGTSVGPM